MGSLVRLVNLSNVLHAVNTTSAIAMMRLLEKAMNGNTSLIPSFFFTLQSASVAMSNANQSDALRLQNRASDYNGESVEDNLKRLSRCRPRRRRAGRVCI